MKNITTYFITTYWYDHYVNNDHCSLCGNRGIIDTRGVKTNAGLEVGRLNWCVCPNGQTLRKMLSKPHPSTPENVEEPTCNCPRFSGTGGFRIADLTCPIHGVNGTDPGDGPWAPENVEEP